MRLFLCLCVLASALVVVRLYAVFAYNKSACIALCVVYNTLHALQQTTQQANSSKQSACKFVKLLYNVLHALQQVTKAVNKVLASNKKAVNKVLASNKKAVYNVTHTH